MGVRLIQFQRLLSGAEYETEASLAQRKRVEAQNRGRPESEQRVIEDGFVEGSEAWSLAVSLGLDMAYVGAEKYAVTSEMFAEPLPDRYVLDQDLLSLIPMGLGGDDLPADDIACEDNEYGAIAWDESGVMFYCPRGVCAISREAWAKGRRACAGC